MPPRPKAGTLFLLLVVAVALSLSSQSGYTDDADIKPTVTLVGGPGSS